MFWQNGKSSRDIKVLIIICFGVELDCMSVYDFNFLYTLIIRSHCNGLVFIVKDCIIGKLNILGSKWVAVMPLYILSKLKCKNFFIFTHTPISC